jgi:hypothetical protein
VGKTQCVKAIANYLLGSPDRMVRFDMNEYLSPGDVSRLVGTLDSPEGLLTAAIRRQPYSVVLLDEIEKAHPAVFDLLLQVLGEGRLTDGLGRTADFRNAIVILTSNLGSKQAESLVGFQPPETPKDQVYLAAAERFFRPEFLNRLDHIIPFDRLSEGDIREISRQAIEALGEREGFVRRKCILSPDDSVLDYVIARGFDPRFGARGVRRMIEKDLIRPVATELARIPATGPTVVQLVASEAVHVEVETLSDLEPKLEIVSRFHAEVSESLVQRLRAGVKRLLGECQAHKPTGAMTTGHIRPEQFHYLTMIEALGQLDQRCQSLLEQFQSGALHHRLTSEGLLAGIQISRRRAGRTHFWRSDTSPSHRIMQEMLTAEDIHDYLHEVSSQSVTDHADGDAEGLAAHLALLEALAPGKDGWRQEEVLLFVRGLQSAPMQRNQLLRMLEEAFQFSSLFGEALADLGLEAKRLRFDAKPADESFRSLPLGTKDLLAQVRSDVLRFEGIRAGALLAGEAGTHLCVLPSGRLVPFQVALRTVPEGQDADEFLQTVLSEHLQWIAKRRTQSSKTSDPLFPLLPVVRIYDERGLIIDLATGRSLDPANLSAARLLNNLILARLPLPKELADLSGSA